MAKALTRIKHGDKDGNTTTYNVGDTVTKSKFSDEEWERLVAAGAIGDEVPEQAPQASNARKTSDLLEQEEAATPPVKANAPKEEEK